MHPERDVRFKGAQRGQISGGRVDLDAEGPADHAVRAIAAAIDKLALRGLYAEVRARSEIAGAPATDAKILLGSVSTSNSPPPPTLHAPSSASASPTAAPTKAEPLPCSKQIEARTGIRPTELRVDGVYPGHDAVDQAPPRA